MQLRTIKDRISTLYSSGIPSDDIRLRPRYIYSVIRSKRSKVLEQRINKKQSISQWNYQTLGCIEIELAPQQECVKFQLPKGCKLYRTTVKMPSILSSKKGHIIQSVTSLDGRVIYDATQWGDFKYRSANKYTGNRPAYFLYDGYLWLDSKFDNENYITITALFDNPIDVFKINNTDTCANYLDFDFPLEGNSLDTTYDLSLNEIIKLFLEIPEDLTNNARESLPEQSK